MHTDLVNSCVLAGEREGEARRKTSLLHAHVVQEVSYTLSYVIKQLQKHRQAFNELLHTFHLKNNWFQLPR